LNRWILSAPVPADYFIVGVLYRCGHGVADGVTIYPIWTDIVDRDVVAIALVRELGPAFTGLLVTGRCATGIASELGSMLVTEQVDAMRAMGTDPSRKAGRAAPAGRTAHASVVDGAYGFHRAAGRVRRVGVFIAFKCN